MRPSERVELETGRWLLFAQYFTYLAASIALTVATAYYLWNVETSDNGYSCTAPITSSSDSNTVNVTTRFEVILKIYFTVFIVDSVRLIVLLIGIFAKSKKIAKLYEAFGCNDCLAFAALIILHVYRFQYAGRACSLDNSTSS